MRPLPDLSDKGRAGVSDTGSAAVRSNSRQNRIRGQAVIEAALLMPGLVFLFVGAFDTGFYCY
jgi:hypothetical protein